MNSVNAKSSRPKLAIVSDSLAAHRVPYNQMDDAQLVVLCQKNDQAAFEALVKRHQRNVFAMLYRLAPDWNDTADLAQEALIRIWRGIYKLKNPYAFKSWMAQIVTNLFYDELRRHPRQVSVLSLDAPLNSDEDQEGPSRDICDPSAGPDELFDRKDVMQSVDAAFAMLPRQFRTAIILREIEDLPYEEIAKITNTDLGTIKSRISRARTRVQKVLRPQFRPDNAA